MSVSRSNEISGLAGISGGFAPLSSGLLVPITYLPTGTSGTQVALGNHSHQSFLGYNAVGASWETLTINRSIWKKFTLTSAGVVESVEVHLRPSVDNTVQMYGMVVADNSNAPGVLVASVYAGTTYLSNSGSMPGAGRWFGFSTKITLPAGDYWGGFVSDNTRYDVAYDGSGSDQYFTANQFIATGAYPSAWAITTGTRNYSIRVSVLI